MSVIRIPQELAKFPDFVLVLSDFISLLYKPQRFSEKVMSELSEYMTQLNLFADNKLDDTELDVFEAFLDQLYQDSSCDKDL